MTTGEETGVGSGAEGAELLFSGGGLMHVGLQSGWTRWPDGHRKVAHLALHGQPEVVMYLIS